MPERGKMWVEKAENIKICDNRWINSPNIQGHGIDVDMATVKNYREGNNTLVDAAG